MNRLLIAAMACGVGTGAAQAQMTGFDPQAACGPFLRAATDTDKLMVAAWANGFLSGSGQGGNAVDIPNVNSTLQSIFEDCIADETLSLVALVRGQSATADAPAAPAENVAPSGLSGTREEAEALLRRFLEPGADLPALTADLAPTAQDIAAVYGEPLAGKLQAMYAQMFTPGVQIGPKPDQNDLLVVHATTGELKSGLPIKDQFPGGYTEVLPFFIGDQPIVRFKFVKEGEELGLAFDGLIFVNGHWVLMPKPWRALE